MIQNDDDGYDYNNDDDGYDYNNDGVMKSQNGQNLANFQAITSRFWMAKDLNGTYKMMAMIMMI